MTLYNDVPLQFQSQFNSTVPANVFRDDSYLGRFSMGAVRRSLPSARAQALIESGSRRTTLRSSVRSS